MIHELKCIPSCFMAILDGVKTAEFRLNDRDFLVGDGLKLNEYNPHGFTGRYVTATITHVQPVNEFISPPIEAPYVLLSFKHLDFIHSPGVVGSIEQACAGIQGKQ